MKFLPLADFDAVNGALNFNTPDSHVTGGCDIYTTKSTGTDKKLYKSIDKDINTQHAAFLQLGASLSPPNRAAMLASSPGMELFSHSSPFGPLSELSSRRTFAYLIATLNASHPHYDFSHVLRPGDFKRERNLRRVMGNLDSILQNVRPSADSARSGESGLADASGGAVWGPHCWAKIDNEMHLNDCTVFSYNPEVDPFEEDERAIYAVHYFFFSRSLKRVAYLHLRVVPVVSANSPDLVVSGSPSGTKRRRRGGTLGSIDLSSKRARYWLGDRDSELVASYDDEEEEGDDGLTWNRGEDGEIVNPEYDDYDENDYENGFDEDEDDEAEDDDDYESQEGKSPVRGMSEDVVASMEI